MKDLTLSFAAVLALALGIGLGFHWLYPLVDLTNEMAGLFVLVALVLKLIVSKLWSLRRTQPTQADPKADK
jgi:hypothetical protein